MISSIITTVLLAGFLICFGYVIYLKYFLKFTRERFAFFSVTTIAALVSSFILQIYSNQSFVSAVTNSINYIFGTKILAYQADNRDHLIGLIVIVAVIYLIIQLHKNWDGPISQTLFDKRRYQENPTILSEFILQFRDFLSKEKLIIPHKDVDSKKDFNIFSNSVSEKMPWHENVYELLSFSSQQYKIDLAKDYYTEEKVFISKFGQDNNWIAILCSLNDPNESTIRNFSLFCKQQKKDFSKIIIAIKNKTGEQAIVNKYGLDILFRYENEMLNSLVDFSSYEQFISDQFISKEITSGNERTLKDIYVELKGKTDSIPNIPEIEEYIYDWIETKEDNKHLAILGEYGCGKSVLSLKITHELLKKRSKQSRIPILIELRGKSPRTMNVMDILSTWAYTYRLDPSSILKLHKAGKLLILFEGFDEMDMIGDREMRLNHFHKLWEFAIPKSKIIITGRPNFFLDDKELKMSLGIEKPFEGSHYCEAVYLEKFTRDQIKIALRNVDQSTCKQIVEILDKDTSGNFYDLISRPAILYLVAVIWKERKLAEIKEKINSAIIISEFIKYSYSRQDEKKAQFPLSENEREYFMLGVAVSMLSISEYSNQISKADLENTLRKLYKDFQSNALVPNSALQIKRKPLKERMIDNNQAEETISTDVRSCGILVNDLTRKDYFKFAHKSFLEYQVSLFFVESVLQNKEEYNIMMNTIAKSLEVELANFRHSQETMTFTSEILISKLNLSKSDDPLTVCKHLFAILHPNKFLGKNPRIAAEVDMIFSVPSKSRLFSVVNAGLFALILIPGTMFLSKKITNQVELSSVSKVIFGACFIMGLLSFITIILSTTFSRNRGKRLKIWLDCCRQLNIPNEIIKRKFSSDYLTYIETGRSRNIIRDFIIRISVKRKNTNNS